MKRLKSTQSPPSYSDLVHDLFANIRSIRSQYENEPTTTTTGEEKPRTEDNNNDDDGERDDIFAPVVSKAMRIVGPDLSGIQLVVKQRLVELLGHQCIAEARGSCQALDSHEQRFVESIAMWKRSDTWKAPNIWLRQGKSAIEADAACLTHWSRSLLTPESKSTDAKVVYIHPKRAENSTDMDEQLLAEFQSLYELCGFGLCRVFKRCMYKVDPSCWDRTARAVDAIFEEIVKDIDNDILKQRQLHMELQRESNPNTSNADANGNSSAGGIENGTAEAASPYLVLVVWPTEAWHRVKNCLAACTTTVKHQPALGRARVIVQIVPEDLVLVSRSRKSRLIGLACGCYANLSNGALCVLPPASWDIVNNGVVGVNAEDSPRSPNASNAFATKRIHLAICTSQDGRWITFSWCTGRGESLCVQALPLSGPEDKQQQESSLSKDKGGEKSTIITQILAKVSSEVTPPGMTSNFVILTNGLPEGLLDINMLAHYNAWLCTSQNPSQFKCTSIMDDGANNDELRKELDDLAFLSLVADYPAKGSLSGVLLGSLANNEHLLMRHKLDKPLPPPLHLRCASQLAKYLDGLAFDAESYFANISRG